MDARTNAFAASTWFSKGAGSRVDLLGAPSFDWFVLRDLSIGFELLAEYSDRTGPTSLEIFTFGGGPHVGVNIPLSDRVSLHPRVDLVYEKSKSGNLKAEERGTLRADVPLLYHATPHFFVGAGPSFGYDVFAPVASAVVRPETTTLGARALVGTWWGGDDPVGEATTPNIPSPPPASEERFGDSGQIVLTGAADAAFASTKFAGVNGTRRALALSPGLDVFVARNVSVGGAASFGTAEGATLPTITHVGGNLRLGVSFPVSSGLSFWPHAGLAYAHHYQRDINTLSSEQSYDAFVVFASASMLLHVATHAFVGLGPVFSADLTRTSTPSGSPSVTQLGVGLVIGGWL